MMLDHVISYYIAMHIISFVGNTGLVKHQLVHPKIENSSETRDVTTATFPFCEAMSSGVAPSCASLTVGSWLLFPKTKERDFYYDLRHNVETHDAGICWTVR